MLLKTVDLSLIPPGTYYSTQEDIYKALEFCRKVKAPWACDTVRLPVGVSIETGGFLHEKPGTALNEMCIGYYTLMRVAIENVLEIPDE